MRRVESSESLHYLYIKEYSMKNLYLMLTGAVLAFGISRCQAADIDFYNHTNQSIVVHPNYDSYACHPKPETFTLEKGAAKNYDAGKPCWPFFTSVDIYLASNPNISVTVSGKKFPSGWTSLWSTTPVTVKEEGGQLVVRYPTSKQAD